MPRLRLERATARHGAADCSWCAVGERVHALVPFAHPRLMRERSCWTGLLWGGLVRMFFVHHVTWSVNSVCHTFGRRPFETTDRSRNHWVVGLLALGEGWHNNHHAFPRSAVHGLDRWQFDLSAWLIAMLKRSVSRRTSSGSRRRRSPESASASVRARCLPCAITRYEAARRVTCCGEPPPRGRLWRASGRPTKQWTTTGPISPA